MSSICRARACRRVVAMLASQCTAERGRCFHRHVAARISGGAASLRMEFVATADYKWRTSRKPWRVLAGLLGRTAVPPAMKCLVIDPFSHRMAWRAVSSLRRYISSHMLLI